MGSLRDIRWIVEGAHHCKAKYSAKVTVHEKRGGSTVFYGLVHIFELHGHPSASRAYAFAFGGLGNAEESIVTVLQKGAVTGPEEAVRAALAKLGEADGR